MKKIIRKLAKSMVVMLYKMMCIILPVNKKRVVFDSNIGKSYSGNPKYIYEYLVSIGEDKKLDIVWFYESSPYDIPGKVKQVKFRSLSYLYNMATANVWVFDSRQPQFLKRRKNTCYIQTWHGTPLKRLALDLDDVFMEGESDIDTYKRQFAENVSTWDYLIAQNEYSSEIFRRAFAFDKKMLTIGYPRNDVLVNCNNAEYISRLKEELRLPRDKKVLLYAPTWRDDEYTENKKYKFKPQIDFDMLKQELSDGYVLIVKYHYLIMDAIDWSGYEGFIYNFDQSEDIAKLYLVSDGLITDYSSVMFDFSVLKRPMYFFAYDYAKYKDELRGFYFDYNEEMPGPISTTTAKLVADIKGDENFEEKYNVFYKKYNALEDGKACENVYNIIKDFTA